MEIRKKWFYRLGLILLLFIILYVFLKLKPMWEPVLGMAARVLIPFLIAGFISYLLHPVVEFLNAKGVQRGLSIAIIYLLFFGGVGLAVYQLIPVVTAQLRELSESAPLVQAHYVKWMNWMEKKTADWPFGVHEQIDDAVGMLEKKLAGLMDVVMSYAIKLFNFVVLIALIPFIAFYLLKDFDAVKKAVWYMTPKKWRKQGLAFLRDVDMSLGGYIRGQIIVCTAIGVISALAFWMVGMKYPLLLGVLIGITNIVPYFGPLFGAIPVAIVASTISIKMVIIVVSIVLVLQFLEGNVLSPLIVGKSLHMHPIFIMFALLVGGEVSGIVGMIVAVPILAILKVTILHAQIHFSKKNTRID